MSSRGWTRCLLGALMAVACLVACWKPCLGQQDEADPTGGLREKWNMPSLPGGASREELVQKWDLNGDGTIDTSEAAIAKARMRKARMEMQLDSSLDPVTGKPRTADGDDVGEAAARPDGLPPEPVPSRATTTSDRPTLPGTRVPTPVTSSSGTNGSAAPGTTATKGRGTPPSSGAFWGGLRAGAPAARPGYGSLGPKPDLNAGRPRSLLPGTGGAPYQPRGGLMPSTTGRPGASSPPPITPKPPRVTAEDIGGY